MGKIRNLMMGTFVSGLVLSIGVFSASAETDSVGVLGKSNTLERSGEAVSLDITPNAIPLEVAMTPQRASKKGTFIDVSKRLTWYDGSSTTYYVTYMNGYGAYEFQGTAFTSYAVTAPTVRYNLLSGRTQQTWNDFVSVRGNKTSTKSMSGSISLTR